MKGHIPRDIRDRLELPWALDKLLKFLLKIVEWRNMYEYPMDHDPDEKTISRGLYGVWKCAHPVLKAAKGSGLEDYFSKQKYATVEFLPEGFEKKKEVRLSAVGDLMKNLGTKHSRDKLYEFVEEKIFGADYSVANLESLLTKKRIKQIKYDHRGGPSINSTLEDYRALIEHEGTKFDAVCLCNNHTWDQGEEGFFTTLNQLEKDEIKYFGVNEHLEDSEKCLIEEIEGLKIGFIGFTYGLNLNDPPEEQKFRINKLAFHSKKFKGDLSPIKRQMDYCNGKNCDFVILTLHWGLEYEFYPTPKQVEIAHELAEYGADLIISHHTHNIQPFEIYEVTRDIGRKVPIFYGLGNLTSNKSAAHVVLNLIANFTLAKGKITLPDNEDAEDNKKEISYVQDINLTPVFQREFELPTENEAENAQIYVQIEKLSEALRKDIEDPELKKYLATMKQYADQTIGEAWNS